MKFFLPELKNIARELRENHGYWFARARLYPAENCIRICTWWGFGEVVAAIRLWCGEGGACRMVVTSPKELGLGSRQVFLRNIPRTPIRFENP